MAVTDWSTTPASNTSLAAINLSEGSTLVADFNNAIRQIMADVRFMRDDLVSLIPSTSGFLPASGGTFTGTQPIYTGRGAYIHHNTSGLASGRLFLQATGSPPTMANGDILAEY